MKKMMSIVLAFLGVKTFSKDEQGKSLLSEEQRKKLQGQFGDAFTTKFEAALAEEEGTEETSTAELVNAIVANNGDQVAQLSNTIASLQNEVTGKNEQIASLQNTVTTLSSEPEGDPKAEGNLGLPRKAGVATIMKVNMSKPHYAAVAAFLMAGVVSGAAASTIDVGDLKTEFGTFLNAQRNLDIVNQVFTGFDTSKYMTTKLATTEYRATQALITSVVQQFTPKWTPSGKTKFTPIVIKNHRHKINVPIVPAEVLDSYMLALYDEGLSPDQMPITRFIVQNLILPRILQDIELRMIAKGKYKEKAWSTVNEGDAGTPPEEGMDGFETILVSNKASNKANINYFKEANSFDYKTADDEEVLEYVNNFVDWINPQYVGQNMPVFCSLDFYKRYKRAYKKIYGIGSSNGGDPKFGSDTIDFSNNVLTPLQSMYRSPILFSTPKENFIKLRHKNEVPSIVNDIQKHNYEARHFGEFWLGAGFAIGEGVFAAVPNGYDPFTAITETWGASSSYQEWNDSPDSTSGGI